MIVVEEIIQTETSLLTIPHKQMHIGRTQPLQISEQLGIDTKLHDVLRACRSRQFGIQNLIAEIAQVGWRIALYQEIRIAPPWRTKEHGLKNHIGTGLHRLERQLGAILQFAFISDFNDGFAFVFEVLKISRLMLKALFLQQLIKGVGSVCLALTLYHRLYIKEARMMTPQEGHQIRWRVENLAVI